MACSSGIPSAAFEAQSVSIAIGGKRLLDDVSLALEPGRVTCILGPNGAGKSTLLKVLAGAMRPHAGEVVFGRRPLGAWPGDALARRRAVLSQSTALAFPFRAAEVARLGRSPHAGWSSRTLDDQIVASALAAADVTHLAERRYPTLSGGEQQRVQLARVLAQIMDGSGAFAGRWLMLDEPTSSLDLVHQHHVLTLARRVATSGGGVLAILHDLNLAAAVADRLCLMKDGQVVAVGGVAETLRAEVVEAVFGIPAEIVPHPSAPIPLVVPTPPRTAGLADRLHA